MAVAVYKGISTINNTFGSIKLTDTDLIKRDILNHFAMSKGGLYSHILSRRF